MADPSIIEKIKHYCAYQERSQWEVRNKLIELHVYGLNLENVVVELISENYLNEERFARQLARGKFKLKQWGKAKIKQALKQHQVSDYCIKAGLSEIDDTDYLRTLDKLAEQKWNSLNREKNRFIKMTKTRNFLLQRGFESELIADWLNDKTRS